MTFWSVLASVLVHSCEMVQDGKISVKDKLRRMRDVSRCSSIVCSVIRASRSGSTGAGVESRWKRPCARSVGWFRVTEAWGEHRVCGSIGAAHRQRCRAGWGSSSRMSLRHLCRSRRRCEIFISFVKPKPCVLFLTDFALGGRRSEVSFVYLVSPVCRRHRQAQHRPEGQHCAPASRVSKVAPWCMHHAQEHQNP